MGSRAQAMKRNRIRRATRLLRNTVPLLPSAICLVPRRETDVRAIVRADHVIPTGFRRQRPLALAVLAHAVQVVRRVQRNEKLILACLALIARARRREAEILIWMSPRIQLG